MFGIPAIVAINSFPTDTPAEVEAIREVALAAGARDAVVATHFVDGGAGAAALAEAVWAATQDGSARFQLLYPDEMPLAEKIVTIATRVYGADGVEFLPAARKSLEQFEDLGYGHLPICMAKTQYSLSHDAALKNRPTGFTVPIREVRLSAGAGFVTPLCGEMRTMPGLPSRAGRREDRHRRRREHRRAVLDARRAAAARGRQAPGRPSRARSRTRSTSPSTTPSMPAPQAATIDRAERFLGMGMVVVAVVVAVVVEGVMGDGAGVAGCVGVVRAGRHRPVPTSARILADDDSAR